LEKSVFYNDNDIHDIVWIVFAGCSQPALTHLLTCLTLTCSSVKWHVNGGI